MSTKNTTSISLDEWIATLEKLEQENKKGVDSPSGLSISDLSEKTGMPLRQARRYLKTLIERGEAEWVGRELRPAMDGICRPIPIYRLTPKKQAATKKKKKTR